MPKEPQGRPRHGGPERLPRRAPPELAAARGQRRASTEEPTQSTPAAGPITLNIDPKKQDALEKAVNEPAGGQARPRRSARSTQRPGRRRLRRPEDRQGRRACTAASTTEALHATTPPARDYQPALDLQAGRPRRGPGERSETQDGEPITPNTVYDGTSKRPVVGSDGRLRPARTRTTRTTATSRVQTATNKSINSVFAQMVVDVGTAKVKKTAARPRHGRTDGWPEAVPAMTLGTMGASPLEMAGVYATLDNHGKKVTPTIVKSAEHKDRAVELGRPDRRPGHQPRDRRHRHLGPDRRGRRRYGSGRERRRAHYQAAGKTGTSENNRSAWFTGYTPDLVTAVAPVRRGRRRHRQAGHPDRHRSTRDAPTAVASRPRSGRRTPSARSARTGRASSTWTPTWAPADGRAAPPTPTPTPTPSPTESETRRSPTQSPTPDPDGVGAPSRPSGTATPTPTTTVAVRRAADPAARPGRRRSGRPGRAGPQPQALTRGTAPADLGCRGAAGTVVRGTSAEGDQPPFTWSAMRSPTLLVDVAPVLERALQDRAW